MTRPALSDLLPSLLAGVVVYPQGPWDQRTRQLFVGEIQRLARRHRCPITLAHPTAREIGAALALGTDDSVSDFLAWDTFVHDQERSPAFVLGVRSSAPVRDVPLLDGLLRRYQRLLPLPPNDADPAMLAAVLDAHRSLHDLSLPLVRADYDHALDTWRWLLHLAPRVDLSLQCAALFHDVERLESEAYQRKEHLEADYLGFKVAHARRGGEIVAERLAGLGLSIHETREVERLVSHHERPDVDPRLQLLNDSDALSFFSLNSYGYLRYFGVPPTRAKVRYTLSRMSPGARTLLDSLHLHPHVRELLAPEMTPFADAEPMPRQPSGDP